MNKKQFGFSALGAAALATALIALPSHSMRQEKVTNEPIVSDDNFFVVGDADSSSWLGVATAEVSPQKAKALNLPAERGVLLEKILENSPALKAGLKQNDVITELNGQRIEGSAQFHRLIHEIPPGRTIQLTVWRDGHSQSLSVTLGHWMETRSRNMQLDPGTYSFRMPTMPELPEIPEVAGDFSELITGHPRLGIDAEDLSGQLAQYFGAPGDEGILVREVNSGSPAEKAGLKAGDVITALDGEQVRSVDDLRQKLSSKRDGKETAVKLSIWRNKSQSSVSVELPPVEHGTHTLSMRRRSI